MLMRSPGRARRQMSGCTMTTDRGVPHRLGGYGFDFMSLFGGGGQQQQPGVMYDQHGNPVVMQQQSGGDFWSAVVGATSEVTKTVTGTVGTIGQTIQFVTHPEEFTAARQAEAATAQAYAAGQQSLAQVEYERVQARARTMRWVIGGTVLIVGGLVFAKILRRT